MNKISFNVPFKVKSFEDIITKLYDSNKFCGDGYYTKYCNSWIETNFKTNKALLTTSCTHALEMSAILSNITDGDEVIMPSFTFVSTANAFVLRGAKIVFVDIRPDTMNIDENLIENAITDKTKAIVPVHYGGVSCEMDTIKDLAKKYSLLVIEDAAQGVMAKYKGRILGTLGDLGAYSFHETKNYHCGEGGALLINNSSYLERAEIIREKGTDRSKFLRGQVDKYSWVDVGSSYLPSEFNAAYLSQQLDLAKEINNKRLHIWNRYNNNFSNLNDIELQYIPEDCENNGHLFYIKLKDLETRQKLIQFLSGHSVQTAFHYVPLHSSKAGIKYGRFSGNDVYTTKESERLLRLPFYFDLSDDEIDYITDKVYSFFGKKL